MEDYGHKKKGTNKWLVIGVVVLIALLLLWLTFADLTGDTDVAAFAAPGSLLNL